MNDDIPLGLPARFYFRMIEAARGMAEDTLRRLLELHNRYPSDLPVKAFARLLNARDLSGNRAQRPDGEGLFSRQ